jgi:mono/diheme cytochrome c family protein
MSGSPLSGAGIFARAFFMLVMVVAPVVTLVAQPATAPANFVKPGPFFEPGQPFFHTQVEVAPDNFVVRGVLLPVGATHAVVFDQELLRVAALWRVPEGEPPVTERTMAQISYQNPRKKVFSEHPQPAATPLLATGMVVGGASDRATLFTDPRPPGREGDQGRGPLPVNYGRFEGIQLAGDTAILHYRLGDTLVRDWFESPGGEASVLARRMEIAAHAAPLELVLGHGAAPWQVSGTQRATTGELTIATSSDGVTLSVDRGQLIATIAPVAAPQQIVLVHSFGTGEAPLLTAAPPPDSAGNALRWPGAAAVAPQLGKLSHNGLTLDQVPVPEENPWRRRIRPADLAFLSADTAAVVTYDGDVWQVGGLADPTLAHVTWRRYASGLHEPLAIAAPAGVVQVWTKNGVVRLQDTDGNGEADWYANFNDQVIQSQTTRSFPLDMVVDADGYTYVSQGGIVDGSGIKSGGAGTPHAGAILKISPDGRSSHVFARAAREPFLGLNPRTGILTGSDQQGHFIPASVCYLIRDGDDFGFPEPTPGKLTAPLVWIPHAADTSSTSQVWTPAQGFGAWSDRMLHLSYGKGRMFAIAPDLAAPVPQGMAIPLGLELDFPLLHARVPPGGGAVWLAGFQIWGTSTKTMWALGRLRPDPTTPIITPVAARTNAHGVVLEFARPLDPASAVPAAMNVRAWNYRRSAEYGSGYYKRDGAPGSTAEGVSQVVLSGDGRSVFVHLPNLTPAMQLEVRYDLKFAAGDVTTGVVYGTIHALHDTDLVAAGFANVDLSRREIVATDSQDDDISAAQGKEVAVQFGCAGCHFPDAVTGRSLGPSWENLFGSVRKFVDGSQTVADDAYIRQKIFEPQKRRLSAGMVEMPSYNGVLNEQQVQSLLLYIRSLAGAPHAESEDAR